MTVKLKNQKLWGGRFASATHPEVEQFTASIHFDVQLAYHDILGSLAHAAMLQHCEIISATEYHALQQGLKHIAQKIAHGEVAWRVEDEDIHMNIERLLQDEIGEAAGKLHTARSRNDQVALDMHLYLREQVIVIVELLLQLQSTLLALTETYGHIILPGYTHLQRAQPIYLGQYWLAYVAMLQRDVARLQDSWPRLNHSPLGAAALTGTTLPIDRHYVSAHLGFDDIYHNTLDAVSDRDFVVEFLANAALIMMHVSRFSEELILWSSQEFNFISFDDSFSTGSSIMPQKKNPDVAELARGKTGRVYGALFNILTVLKGLPLAYNKDLQEDKEPLFDTVKTLRQTLLVFVPMLSTLKMNVEAMRLAVDTGYLNATALAEYLVKRGLPFRQAHEVAGKMVALCVHKKCRLEDLSLVEMQTFSPAINADIYYALIAENAVNACYKNSGLADESLYYAQHLQASTNWIKTKRELLALIYAKFELPLLGLT